MPIAKDEIEFMSGLPDFETKRMPKLREKSLIIASSQRIRGEDIRKRQKKAQSQQELQEIYERQIRQKNSNVVITGYPKYDTEHYKLGRFRRISPFSVAAGSIIA